MVDAFQLPAQNYGPHIPTTQPPCSNVFSRLSKGKEIDFQPHLKPNHQPGSKFASHNALMSKQENNSSRYRYTGYSYDNYSHKSYVPMSFGPRLRPIVTNDHNGVRARVKLLQKYLTLTTSRKLFLKQENGIQLGKMANQQRTNKLFKKKNPKTVWSLYQASSKVHDRQHQFFNNRSNRSNDQLKPRRNFQVQSYTV